MFKVRIHGASSGELFGGRREWIPRDAGDGQGITVPGNVVRDGPLDQRDAGEFEQERGGDSSGGVCQRRSAGGAGRAGWVRRDAGGESVRWSVDVDRWSVRWRWRWIRGEHAGCESVRRRRRGRVWGAVERGRLRVDVDDERIWGAVHRWGVRWITGRRRIWCECGEFESVRWGGDDVRFWRVAEFGSERRFVRRRRHRGWVRCVRDAVRIRGTVHDGWIRSKFGRSRWFRIERAGGESVRRSAVDAGRLWGERADERLRRRADAGSLWCRADA